MERLLDAARKLHSDIKKHRRCSADAYHNETLQLAEIATKIVYKLLEQAENQG